MKIIDTTGQKCPVPIIETRKALRESKTGETFTVITDNKTAFSNISRFLEDNKIFFSVTEEKNIWTFSITNETGVTVTTQAEDYCEIYQPVIPAGDYAVVISSEVMGQGDDELGRRLMKSFFIALSCLDVMPSSIMFYNAGVKLTVDNSEVIEFLRELENKGVPIYICGTCVDYYKIEERVKIGRISDMFIITQKLSEAGNIIRP